jgi:hypothetical protein
MYEDDQQATTITHDAITPNDQGQEPPPYPVVDNEPQPEQQAQETLQDTVPTDASPTNNERDAADPSLSGMVTPVDERTQDAMVRIGVPKRYDVIDFEELLSWCMKVARRRENKMTEMFLAILKSMAEDTPPNLTPYDANGNVREEWVLNSNYVRNLQLDWAMAIAFQGEDHDWCLQTVKRIVTGAAKRLTQRLNDERQS